MTPVRSETRSTSRRQIALVVLALLLAVVFAYPGSGLLLGWSSTEDGGIHRFHTAVWGVHTGLVLGTEPVDRYNAQFRAKAWPPVSLRGV